MCHKRAFQRNSKHHFYNTFSSQNAHPFKKAWKEHFKSAWNMPPANVKEIEDKYEIHLFAPGFEKSDFTIAITDNTLHISTVDKNTEESIWQRQEYAPKGFLRKFGLNKKMDTTAITAKYENGVLILHIPKLAGFETTHQEISIA